MTSTITYKDLGQNQLKIVFYFFFSPFFTSFYVFFVVVVFVSLIQFFMELHSNFLFSQNTNKEVKFDDTGSSYSQVFYKLTKNIKISIISVS